MFFYFNNLLFVFFLKIKIKMQVCTLNTTPRVIIKCFISFAFAGSNYLLMCISSFPWYSKSHDHYYVTYLVLKFQFSTYDWESIDNKFCKLCCSKLKYMFNILIQGYIEGFGWQEGPLLVTSAWLCGYFDWLYALTARLSTTTCNILAYRMNF